MIKMLTFFIGLVSLFIILSSLSLLLVFKIDESFGTIYILSLFFLSFSLISLKLLRVFFIKNALQRVSKVLLFLYTLSCIAATSYILVRFILGRTLLSFLIPMCLIIIFLKRDKISARTAKYVKQTRIKDQIIIRGLIIKEYTAILRVYPMNKLQVICEHVSKTGNVIVRRFPTSSRVYLKFTTSHFIDSKGRSRLIEKILNLIQNADLLDLCHLGVLSNNELTYFLDGSYESLKSGEQDIKSEYDRVFAFLKSLYVIRSENVRNRAAKLVPTLERKASGLILNEDGDRVIARAMSSPTVDMGKEQLRLQCLLYSIKIDY